MTPEVLRLRPADADRYTRLRGRMLLDSPWAYAASPDEDRALDPARVAEMLAADRQAIFAVESVAWPAGPESSRIAPGELIAAAGIVRRSGIKFAHRAQLWGVFVAPEARGRGLGRSVVSTAIEEARSWPGVDYVDLGVSEVSSQARRLYESLGFTAWGREPESLQHGGRRYDEIFMTLRLRVVR